MTNSSLNNISGGYPLFRLKRNQKTILDHDVYLPDHKVQALDKTWAGPFRRQILPLIDEEKFRHDLE